MRDFRKSVAVSAVFAAVLTVAVPGGAANAGTTMIENSVPECVVDLTEPVSNGETMSITGTLTCPEGTEYSGWGWLWFEVQDDSQSTEPDTVGIIEGSSRIITQTVVAKCVSGRYATKLVMSLGPVSGSGNGGYNVAVSDPVTISC
ncbi:hypothetical protein ACFYY8_24770 [Streptosporangium sp. NPDC001559]|uniref:hypothetical protein n=1 Tax=Streptosporangium sp. NPDC001559 TaxID=3366187 RepID=UPI0036EAB1FF